jgi:amidohydrolase
MENIAKDSREIYKHIVPQAVDTLRNDLIAISLDIHAHPELNYQEHHASKVLSDALEKNGFKVERGVAGVDTAFIGIYEGGKGDGPTVAILVEYDALPEIGHGCGHNLIAISTLGAGLGAKAALGSLPGRIMVIGTPAEEGGGGKIRLLDAGLFKDVDVVLSSHPSSNRTVIPVDIPMGESWSLAMVGYRYEFHGKAAHAAVMPHEGINALNSVIHLFTGIDALRQHLRDDTRIHGIITDGGTAPNVVPEFAAANFMLRCRNREYLKDVIVEKVREVAEGAAKITGARLDIQPYYPFYENVIPSSVIANDARLNADLIGMHIDDPLPGQRGSGASTDFGNVSQVIPSFAMTFAVSEQPVPGHSKAMTDAAISDLGHDNALAVAKTLGLVACDLLSDPTLLEAAHIEFNARKI